MAAKQAICVLHELWLFDWEMQRSNGWIMEATMNPALDSIESKIIAALLRLDKAPGIWNDNKCTREVKNAIATVGKKLGFEVCATGCGEQGCEWLYDLCWRKQGEGALVDVPLAMECEWGAAR